MRNPDIKSPVHYVELGLFLVLCISFLIIVSTYYSDGGPFIENLIILLLIYIIISIALLIALAILVIFYERLNFKLKKYRAIMVVDDTWANLEVPFAISFNCALSHFINARQAINCDNMPAIIIDGGKKRFVKLLNHITSYCTANDLEVPKILVLDKPLENAPYFRRQVSYFWFCAQLTNCNRFISPDSL